MEFAERLQVFARTNQVESARQLLQKHDLHPDITGLDGCTCLSTAAFHNHTDMVKFLLKQKADPNRTDETIGKLWTPLHRAIVQSNVKVIELLIEAKANFNQSDEEGQTPVHLAAKAGKVLSLNCLIEHSANVRVKDYQGRSPLDLAKIYSHSEVIEILRK